MNNNGNSVAPAIAEAQDSLTILRDVADIYEKVTQIRKSAARVALTEGATYQQLGDALGITRSGAFNFIHRDAA